MGAGLLSRARGAKGRAALALGVTATLIIGILSVGLTMLVTGVLHDAQDDAAFVSLRELALSGHKNAGGGGGGGGGGMGGSNDGAYSGFGIDGAGRGGPAGNGGGAVFPENGGSTAALELDPKSKVYLEPKKQWGSEGKKAHEKQKLFVSAIAESKRRGRRGLRLEDLMALPSEHDSHWLRSDTTVILNHWRRSTLQVQLDALLASSVRPAGGVWVCLFDSAREAEYLDIISFYKGRFHGGGLRYVRSTWNFKYYGRFQLALQATTKFVWVIDDDVVPGTKFLRQLSHVASTTGPDAVRGALGSVGWIMPGAADSGGSSGSGSRGGGGGGGSGSSGGGLSGPGGKYYSYRDPSARGGLYIPDRRYGMPVSLLQEVDVLCSQWFIETDWVRLLFRERWVTPETGEDFMLSYALRKYAGLPSYVMPLDMADSQTWGDVDVAGEAQAQGGGGTTTRDMVATRDALWRRLLRRGGHAFWMHTYARRDVLLVVDSAQQAVHAGYLWRKLRSRGAVHGTGLVLTGRDGPAPPLPGSGGSGSNGGSGDGNGGGGGGGGYDGGAAEGTTCAAVAAALEPGGGGAAAAAREALCDADRPGTWDLGIGTWYARSRDWTAPGFSTAVTVGNRGSGFGNGGGNGGGNGFFSGSGVGLGVGAMRYVDVIDELGAGMASLLGAARPSVVVSLAEGPWDDDASYAGVGVGGGVGVAGVGVLSGGAPVYGPGGGGTGGAVGSRRRDRQRRRRLAHNGSASGVGADEAAAASSDSTGDGFDRDDDENREPHPPQQPPRTKFERFGGGGVIMAAAAAAGAAAATTTAGMMPPGAAAAKAAADATALACRHARVTHLRLTPAGTRLAGFLRWLPPSVLAAWARPRITVVLAFDAAAGHTAAQLITALESLKSAEYMGDAVDLVIALGPPSAAAAAAAALAAAMTTASGEDGGSGRGGGGGGRGGDGSGGTGAITEQQLHEWEAAVGVADAVGWSHGEKRVQARLRPLPHSQLVLGAWSPSDVGSAAADPFGPGYGNSVSGGGSGGSSGGGWDTFAAVIGAGQVVSPVFYAWLKVALLQSRYADRPEGVRPPALVAVCVPTASEGAPGDELRSPSRRAGGAGAWMYFGDYWAQLQRSCDAATAAAAAAKACDLRLLRDAALVACPDPPPVASAGLAGETAAAAAAAAAGGHMVGWTSPEGEPVGPDLMRDPDVFDAFLREFAETWQEEDE